MSPRRHPSPVRKRSRLIPAVLATALVAAGFATLLIRLEVTQEGYRLSALQAEVTKLEEQNRSLHLQAAELSSHARLRALAVKYGLEPVRSGQVVMMP